MQQSNTYIIVFTAIMTIVVGGLLSFTSQILGPAQRKSIEQDTKSQILGSVMDKEVLKKMKRNELLALYDARIASLVVDVDGEEITTDAKGNPIVAEEVNIAKNFKLLPEERSYPVFKYMNEADPNKVEAYILPVYGNGLWDKIWGYVALGSGLEAITGVSFAHKAETPGLGARISSPDIQSRYVGKKIYDQQGELVSVTMLKGEGNKDLGEHQVDGMSGATITGRGVNKMLKEYLNSYQAYFNKVNSGSTNLNSTATSKL